MGKPFYTWVETTYTEQAQVPDTMRRALRELWLKGARPDELAATFKLPLEWVEDFVLDPTRDPRLN